MPTEPTTAHLELVVRHGSGDFVRALATVQLARRRGREDELRELLDEPQVQTDDDRGSTRDGPNGFQLPGVDIGSEPGRDSSTELAVQDLPEIQNVVASGSVGSDLDLDTIAEEMATVYDEFISARDGVLNDIYDGISAKLEHYYTSIHHDEPDFDPDFTPTDTGLQLEVGFYGQGLHPPHALHSEGHQDSMGLCLYLALCDWIDDELPVMMLDDVVMSIDKEHRQDFAELLATEISDNYQLIITTHDELWHRHLRAEGVVTAQNSIQFSDWSLHEGPIIPSHSGPEWDDIDRLLEEGNISGAAHRLHRFAEWFLRESADRLNGRVEFKANSRWTLRDFQSATQSKYKELLKKAKQAEESWGHDISDLSDLDDRRGDIYQRIQATQPAINPNVHYSGDKSMWAGCTRTELEDAISAFRDLYELLWCDNCGACLSVVTEDHEEVRVQCRCGELADWNLQTNPDS